MVRETSDPVAILMEAAAHSRAANHAAAFSLVTRAIAHRLRPELIVSAARICAAAADDESASGALSLAVAGEVTTNAVSAAFHVAAARLGHRARVIDTAYGALTRQVIDPTSDLYEARPDVVLLVPDPGGAATLEADSQPSAAAAVAGLLDRWSHIWGTLMTRLPGVRLLQHVYEEPEEDFAGSVERRLPWSAVSLARAVNDALIANAPSFVHVVDTDRLAARVGRTSWRDPRLWHYGKVPFALKHLADYVPVLTAALRSAIGQPAKALIVDLDNTLWGGSVADEGIDGIRLGPGDPEGEAFQAFGRYVRCLRDRGVILGICSKNDLATVTDVFETHPHLPLRLEDFAAVRCNLDDKASNLAAIARELNIDLSTLVFVDDDPVQCELVRQTLRDVHVVHLDGDPASFVRRLDGERLFDRQDVSGEDLKRTASYRARAKASALQAGAPDLGAYLTSLDMRAEVRPAGQAALPRIAQLEMRTNQFNLSTRRLSLEQLCRAADSSNHIVLAVSLADRFTDHGLVAYIAAEQTGSRLTITDWLMSCRVFSRTLEQFTFNRLVDQAILRGADTIAARYVPTKKNAIMAGLFDALGFERAGAPADGCWEYRVGTQPVARTFVTGSRTDAARGMSAFRRARKPSMMGLLAASRTATD